MLNASRTPRLVLLLIALTIGPALAGDPAGWWTSSSGSRIHLWANMQQVVVTVRDAQGRESKYQGQWTRFSDYFQYSAAGSVFNAAFTGPNQISVTNQSTGAVTVWTRGTAAAPTQAPSTSPPSSSGASMWSSSTGSSVQLSSQGHQVFVTIIGRDGKRHQGSGRWTNYPHTFDYSIPGVNGIANCTFLADGRIQVIYGNQAPSYWTRQ